MSSADEKRVLEDSFDKNEIEQLHKAVLGLSNQSFELKKFCITILVSACTLATTIFRDSINTYSFLTAIKAIVLLIPIFFYLVDISTYYYQDKLRKDMFDIENKIRNRNSLTLKTDDRFSNRNNKKLRRLCKSFLSVSNIIYWGLIVFAIIFIILI
jgi:hypothetical protein